MKNQIKRIFCALLVCCLLISLAACGSDAPANDGQSLKDDTAQSGDVTKVPDGSADDQKQEEEASDETDGVVHIKTPEDFASFAERVNNGEKTLSAVLDADIDMSGICGPSLGNWTPINGMEGTFDGNGHVISNLYCIQSEVASAFGEFSGVLQDLELKDVVMESTEKYAAGLVRSLVGSGVIKNCSVSGSVKGYKEAGGITTYTSDNTLIENCINESAVEGGYYDSKKISYQGYAAGIVSSPSGGTVRGCVNRGEITGTGLSAGGILGGSDIRYFYLEDCTNEGKVQNIAGKELLERYVGGIAGYAGENTLITRCVNKGEISGSYYTAGIVAYSSYVVINCANHGNVTAQTNDGRAYGITFTAIAGMVNCYNTGTVTAERFATGLGYSPRVMEVNLYNYGTVTCTGSSYAVLTDAFPFSSGGADSGLFNVWSKEGCVILPEGHDGDSQTGCGTQETAFTDGTILDALNSAADNLNSGSIDQYEGKSILERFREECDAELSKWVSGSDSLPHFEWE